MRTIPEPRQPTDDDDASVFDAHARWVSDQQAGRSPETKSFSGGFLLYRKVGGKNVRPGIRSQAREPRFRHPTFAAAEAEAARLLPHHPESTFIILQEVARVKLKPVEAIDAA